MNYVVHIIIDTKLSPVCGQHVHTQYGGCGQKSKNRVKQEKLVLAIEIINKLTELLESLIYLKWPYSLNWA
jgi:hypothetical protein